MLVIGVVWLCNETLERAIGAWIPEDARHHVWLISFIILIRLVAYGVHSSVFGVWPTKEQDEKADRDADRI